MLGRYSREELRRLLDQMDERGGGLVELSGERRWPGGCLLVTARFMVPSAPPPPSTPPAYECLDAWLVRVNAPWDHLFNPITPYVFEPPAYILDLGY